MISKFISKIPVSIYRIFCIVLILLSPAACFWFLEIYTHNPFTMTAFPIHLLNIIFFEVFMLFLVFLTGSFKWGLIIEEIFFGLYGLVNYYVYSFRSHTIIPWDFKSVGTALSVADNYQYTLTASAALSVAGYILLIVLAVLLPHKIKVKLPFKILGVVLSLCFMVTFAFFVQADSTVERFDFDTALFTPEDMCEENGTLVSFLYDLKFLFIEKPANYNAKQCENTLMNYKTDETAGTDDFPNIIVIMDEAFSDLSVLGDFTTNTEPMPFLRSMMNGGENAITGYASVSVLGGNTPNSEFEFLTGNTLAFLPQGCIPFQQYIDHDYPSLVSFLDELGYQTAAFHPYGGTGWSRNTTYPLLGFEEMHFQEDYVNPSILRDYVSDQACVDKIIETYEASDHQTPQFLFTVTMQNHSGYRADYDNFNPEVSILDEEVSDIGLDHYLSLIKCSDQALNNLVSYFEKQNKKTIIVFFGDHQPNNRVVSPIFAAADKDVSQLSDEDLAKRYEVPFLIWANFDIPEESNVNTSLNYLAARVLKAADMPMPSYFSFLSDYEKEYPVINSIRVENKDGLSKPLNQSDFNLSDYQNLQYYMMHDCETYAK